MSTSWLILFLSISKLTLSISTFSRSVESQLIHDLFKQYSKYARPVRNSSGIVNINYALSYTMIDLNEVENSQTLIAYELMSWPDESLVWDPALYAGIDQFTIDCDSIWTPIITLYNTMNGVDAVRGQGTAIIHSNGIVTLTRTMKSKVRCKFDTQNFPFDSAYCSLIMGLWVHSSLHINLTLMYSKVDLVDYEDNPRWNLVNATSERRAKKYICCAESFLDIKYENKLVRISNDYALALLAPSFLLSILTILLLLLPNDRVEKVTLGILLFCAFFLILLYTYSVLPAAGTTPYFVVFLMFNLIMLSLIIFLNTLVINLSNYESCQEVPKVLKSIVLEFMAKLFCMTSIVNRNRLQHEFEFEKTNYYKLSVSNDNQPLDPAADDQSNDELVNAKPGLESDVAFIKAFTRSYCQKVNDGEAEKRFRQGWKDVAQVLNRFCCILYIPVVLIAVGVNLIQISSK